MIKWPLAFFSKSDLDIFFPTESCNLVWWRLKPYQLSFMCDNKSVFRASLTCGQVIFVTCPLKKSMTEIWATTETHLTGSNTFKSCWVWLLLMALVQLCISDPLKGHPRSAIEHTTIFFAVPFDLIEKETWNRQHCVCFALAPVRFEFRFWWPKVSSISWPLKVNWEKISSLIFTLKRIGIA